MITSYYRSRTQLRGSHVKRPSRSTSECNKRRRISKELDNLPWLRNSNHSGALSCLLMVVYTAKLCALHEKSVSICAFHLRASVSIYFESRKTAESRSLPRT